MIVCANVHCHLEFESGAHHQRYCSPRCGQQDWHARLTPERATVRRAAKSASMRRARAKTKV